LDILTETWRHDQETIKTQDNYWILSDFCFSFV